MKYSLVILTILFFSICKSPAQITPTDAEFEAQPIGIKDQLDNFLQTQFTMPKFLLQSDFNEKVLVFFNIDSLGSATHLKFDKGLNNLLRIELIKMIRLIHFKRTLHLPNEEAPYFLSIPISSSAYRKYKKQKQKPITNNQFTSDTSSIVYNKVDKSAEYYKEGDEGLAAYFLSELDYPKIAIQQSIEGTVILDFVVETNGYVSNIEVKKGINGGCTEEAVRLIKQTRWQPAVKGNQLVRYKITYPITFNLNAINKAQSIGQ